MAEHQHIRLGLMSPLSGLVEIYGQEISRAGQVAVNEINTAGGLLGRPLELIIEDDGSLPVSAVPAAAKLIDDFGCTAIIGNLLSSSRIAVAETVAEPRRVPYLNFSFYEGSIYSRYFFHFAALPNQQIDKMIPYMAQEFGAKMFFAGSNYEWSRGSIDAAGKALRKAGGEIVGEEYLPMGSTELDELLEELERSGADVFVPYFAGKDQLNLLTRFTERGLKDHMAVVMGHYDENMVSRLSPEIREGFYSSNTYFMTVDTPENKSFLENLRKQPGVTGIWPEGNGILTNFGEGTYNCVQAFAAAVRAAGSLDREDIVDALESVQVTGPQGMLIMNSVSHHSKVNTYLSRCDKNGVFNIIKKFGRIDPVIPELYAANIAQKIKKSARPGVTTKKAPGPDANQGPKRFDHKVGFAHVDNSGNFIYASESFCKFTSINREGKIGQSNLLKLLNRQTYESLKGQVTFLFESFTPATEYTRGVFGYDNVPRLVSFKIYRDIEQIRRPEATFLVTVEMKQGTTASSTTAPPLEKPKVDYGPVAADHLRDILDATDTAVIAADSTGEILEVNACACRFFGYRYEEMIGLSVHLLLPPQYRERHRVYVRDFAGTDTPGMDTRRRGELTGYRRDGSFFPAEGSFSKFSTEEGWILVASIRDTTIQKNHERLLIWNANHDPLTKLANRNLIEERIDAALERVRNKNANLGLLFIDLDEFKLINDSYGHEAGDELLIKTADRLLASARPGDIIGRFAGDEFIILCENRAELPDMVALAEKIVESLKQPFQLYGDDIVITGSIGLVIGGEENENGKTLIRNADAAMYTAKEGGRNSWKLYDEQINIRAKQQLSIASGLRLALERNEMQLRYQPIVDTFTEEIVGAEALLRWFPPSGFVSPAVFIPIAEITGSIYELGLWVFEEACKTLVKWHNDYPNKQPPYISVNVSTRQLNEARLVQDFARVLSETGANPDHLLMEITETALMSDPESNMGILRQLADMRLRVAVDDFGTGYSSLSQLALMPVSYLKVDRAFVDMLDKNQKMRDIVTAVINMSHAMKLRVIAEGVETLQHLEILRVLNCDRIQGFYFYKPMEYTELEAIIQEKLKNPKV